MQHSKRIIKGSDTKNAMLLRSETQDYVRQAHILSYKHKRKHETFAI